MGGHTRRPRPRGDKGVRKSKLRNKDTYKEEQHKRVSHSIFTSFHHTTHQTYLSHVRCQQLLSRITKAYLRSRARRGTHHRVLVPRTLCQEVYPTSHHRREPPHRPLTEQELASVLLIFPDLDTKPMPPRALSPMVRRLSDPCNMGATPTHQA